MSSVKCQKVETYVEKLFCPICDVEMKYPNISYKEAKKNAKRN